MSEVCKTWSPIRFLLYKFKNFHQLFVNQKFLCVKMKWKTHYWNWICISNIFLPNPTYMYWNVHCSILTEIYGLYTMCWYGNVIHFIQPSTHSFSPTNPFRFYGKGRQTDIVWLFSKLLWNLLFKFIFSLDKLWNYGLGLYMGWRRRYDLLGGGWISL